MTDNQPKGFHTRAIHAGAQPDPTTGARVTPIYQTTSYVFKDPEHAARLFGLQELGFIYSRLTNPTIGVLEARLADLEGGVGASCTASGHAAQLMTFFALMSPGDHIVAAKKLYGGTVNQLAVSFPRAFGWQTTFVDTDDLDAVKAAITPKTKCLFVESLANPGGIITDMQALARIAEDAGIPFIVDNTMATPYLCRPIEHGASIVVHSTTKFLSGHGNSVGGAVIDSGKFDWAASGNYPALAEPDPGYHGLNFHETFGELALTMHGHAVGLRDLGTNQQPMNAFLTITGIETLPLRMQRHCDSAQQIAEYLADHPKVDWVQYAGLPQSPYHSLARKYLPKGSGAVFTFGVTGGYEAGRGVVEQVQLFSHLANIGDTRSLIIHPASTTHSQLTPEDRAAAGAGDDVVRLSIGLEDPDDIIADLDQALAKV